MGDCAYIIEKGRVEILYEAEGRLPRTVSSRGPGAMIGEMSLIDNAPRSATIKALEDCHLLEIARADFSRRLDDADPVLKMAMQVILTRYRDMLTRAEIRHDETYKIRAETLEQLYNEHSDVLDSIKIANEFQVAMQNKEIFLHYQPIVNLQTGHIDGFEALMRWNHPERGFISPAVFIPILESNGQIVHASQWALKESLEALKRIEQEAADTEEVFMSVNFSSHDFAAEDFVEGLYKTLSETDIAPSRVHLEITERLLMGQPENARTTLEMCRKAGMHISIDDFGTGYSSLSYLHYFPIDTLKIDRSFVINMAKEKGATELIKSIIGLGKNLGMRTVAEGIETKEEAVMLRDLGCDQAQGYFFARPLPEADVIKFIKTHHKIKF